MNTDPLSPYYHVGIVVPDIARARVALSEQLGVTWGPVFHFTATEYREASGDDLVLPTTMCYSVEEPHLELIQEVPGSIWVCNDHSNLHHIGFWGDDFSKARTELVGSGCPLEIAGRSGDRSPVAFTYHRNDLGIRIEIVDGSMRDAMSFLFESDEN